MGTKRKIWEERYNGGQKAELSILQKPELSNLL